MSRVKEFDEEQVLKKALNVFWCKGYNGTSMQDLIDGLGISRSSLYDTYGDKRSLFLAALKMYHNIHARATIDMITKSDSILDTIKLIFKQTIEESVSDKLQKGCFAVNSSIDLAPHDKEITGIINANQKEVEDAFYKAVKKGQESGEISSRHSARMLARFILNTNYGIRVNAKTTNDKKFYDDILQVVLSILIDK
jgi:TetR/AcrR family transcriptional regulator, transcriptional repressor for nem operon